MTGHAGSWPNLFCPPSCHLLSCFMTLAPFPEKPLRRPCSAREQYG